MPILKVGELDLISHSPEQTLRMGVRLGMLLSAGQIVCLSGEMGAGKTVFCSGLGQGWGALDPVVSPTYTLVHQHRRESGRDLMYHLDCYRLNHADEADSIELDDLLDSGAVLLIEWPEKILSRLPAERLWVRLRTVDATHRSLSFLPTGAEYISLVEQFRQKVIGE